MSMQRFAATRPTRVSALAMPLRGSPSEKPLANAGGPVAKRKKAYRVGYKKPPQATRFKPGQSGNPRGRPKRSKNLVSAIQKEMNERISITENGRKKRISKRDAIAKQYVNKSIAGD